METYYQDIIPSECTTGNITLKGNEIKFENPVLYFEVQEWSSFLNKYVMRKGKYYEDGLHNPVVLEDYKNNTEIVIYIQYEWFDSPAPDYTLKIYSKHDL